MRKRVVWLAGWLAGMHANARLTDSKNILKVKVFCLQNFCIEKLKIKTQQRRQHNTRRISIII